MLKELKRPLLMTLEGRAGRADDSVSELGRVAAWTFLQSDGAAAMANSTTTSARLSSQCRVGGDLEPARCSRYNPGGAADQGLGKVPECLVHGLVMPSRGRMRVVWRA
jgi:hypothetical protein